MSNNKMTDMSPLFNINILRFAITLTSFKTVNISDIRTTYRGQIGYCLKQISCQFDQFQTMDCADCNIPENCYYTSLFSPISALQITKDEKIKMTPSPVRPFVFSFMTDEKTDLIRPDKAFKIIFSVFGPGIQYSYIFSSAAILSAENMGFTVKSINLLYPENQTTEKKLTLNDWIKGCDVGDQKLILRCHTPLSMKKNNQVIQSQVDCLDIIKAIIRRLRDLKRYYGNDENMGHITKEYYETAKAIHCATKNTVYQRKKRYSHHQQKLLPLSGFLGDIVLSGNLHLFIPLLKAGELVHIGRGTSSGNGCVSCNNEQDISPNNI
jgi:CRISPR-associated endoribonuclease Cas6